MEQTMVKYRVVLLKVVEGSKDKMIHSFTRPCTQSKAEKIFNQLLLDWGLKYDKDTGFDPPPANDAVYPAIVAVE